jgi:hypothetical protein
MNYAEINNTTLIQYPYGFAQLQADNPYTNYGGNNDVAYWFPQTNAAIVDGYTLAEVIIAPQPPYDVAHQNCTQNANPTLINGIWTLGWTVTNFTPEEQAAYYANLAKQNSTQAKQILTNTDWTSIADVADPAKSNPYLTNQAEFITYRSTIRNIAVNPTWDAVFPTAPTEVWSN